MLVQLTPPQPTSTASPAQQVLDLVGLQISQSAHQLQELICKAATAVSAATTTSSAVGTIHVAAAFVADTAMNMANKEVDQAVRAIHDPLGTGAAMLRDKLGGEISRQAQTLEKKLQSGVADTNPTSSSPDGKTPFLSQSNDGEFQTPQSLGDILSGKTRRARAETQPEPEPPQRQSLVGNKLGLPTKSSLLPHSLAV